MNPPKHLQIAVVTIALSALLVACGDEAGSADSDELKVAASTGVAAEVVERVAGDEVAVVQVVPDGASPHSYAASAQDRQELATSQLLVYVSSALEEGLPLDAASSSFELAEHVETTLEIEEGEGHSDGERGGGGHAEEAEAHSGEEHSEHHAGHGEGERHSGEKEHGEGKDEHAGHAGHGEGDQHAEGEGHSDAKGAGGHSEGEAGHSGEEHAHEAGSEGPHVWLDPTQVAAAVPELAEALAEIDPEGAEGYRERAAAYVDELFALDVELAEMTRQVPKEDRKLVTSHDAFGYFADRYDFEVVGAAFGTVPEAEASAQRIAELVEAIDREDVPAVFAQEGDDPEVLERIAAEADVAVVDDLQVSAPSESGSYEEMMRSTTAKIVEALSD